MTSTDQSSTDHKSKATLIEQAYGLGNNYQNFFGGFVKNYNIGGTRADLGGDNQTIDAIRSTQIM